MKEVSGSCLLFSEASLANQIAWKDDFVAGEMREAIATTTSLPTSSQSLCTVISLTSDSVWIETGILMGH